MIQDITAFKQVAAEIRSALAEATELSALKTRFVSMASHELRTPLTVIRTSIELLRAYGLSISPEKHHDYLDRMQSSINTMKCLTAIRPHSVDPDHPATPVASRPEPAVADSQQFAIQCAEILSTYPGACTG